MNKTNKRAILVGLESSYKSGSATASEVLKAREINITPLAGSDIERKFIQSFYGNASSVAGEKHAIIDVELEFAGSGAAGSAPQYASLLKACGMAEKLVATKTATYTPVSEQEASLVIHAHADGNLHKVRGARGSFGITADVNTIPIIKFRCLGLIEPVTAVNIPTAAPAAWELAQPINTRNTRKLNVHGQVVSSFSKFGVDMAINVAHRQVVGNNDVVITDRKPTGNMTIEDPGVTTINYFDKSQAGSLGAVKFAHGVGAGNIIEINMPKCGLGSPSYSDSDGVQMLDMSYTPTPNQGNDEISIVYK